MKAESSRKQAIMLNAAATDAGALNAPATAAGALILNAPAADRGDDADEPVIFLDIDGVLNTYNITNDHEDAFHPAGWESNMRDSGFVLSRQRLERLATLIQRHAARIVLSTAWRFEHGARRALAAALTELAGLPATIFVGVTPELRERPRAAEVAAWLKQHDPAGRRRWIAIDDIDLARDAPEAMAGHFVHTSIEAGLTEARAVFADGLLRKSSEAQARVVQAAAPPVGAGAPPARSDSSIV